MITDAVEIEKYGLWGRAYVDGADHLRADSRTATMAFQTVRRNLRQVGIPVTYDTGRSFSLWFPMNDCALYYGGTRAALWGHSRSGIGLRARRSCGTHPFLQASTLRSAGANGGPAARGARASLGNVYEPTCNSRASRHF